ncbi:MAG: MFS transporter [Firmicutes bacterium]|nr:MFS transporter [Bacillota bacterium]
MLRRHADFNKLWFAQTVSVIGSQVTGLALPLAAVLTLSATPWQMGVLSAASSLPWLLCALVVGVWVDRLRRRPVLIAADLLRGLFIASVPAAAALGRLSMLHLYVVAFATGVLTVFFDLAHQAYLPALVERRNVVEGNAKLQLSQSVSMLVGPGLAGALVQALTAPFALIVDALSFFVSAAALALIRRPEPPPAPSGRGLAADVAEGLRFVFRQPVLRALVGYAATSNFSWNMLMAILVLYVTRVLGLSALEMGAAISLGALGGVAGALTVQRLAGRFGVGRMLVAVALLDALGAWMAVLASGPHALRLVIFCAAAFVVLFSSAASNTLTVSLRQAITPDALLGRMTATVRFVIWGVNPLAALAGGALGEWLGLRATLVASALLSLATLPWIRWSPLRDMAGHPAGHAAPAPPPATASPEPAPPVPPA